MIPHVIPQLITTKQHHMIPHVIPQVMFPHVIPQVMFPHVIPQLITTKITSHDAHDISLCTMTHYGILYLI